jgi:ubiquinone biosynthesis protein
LRIDPTPLGVASMAQVHAAEDATGKRWVVKIVKPKAATRLKQSLAALQLLLDQGRKLPMTQGGKLWLDQLQSLHDALLREIDLSLEAKAIAKASKALSEKRSILRIPEVASHLSSDSVLVIQRFEGKKLSDIVAGRVEISDTQRSALARGLLGELLIQVFELGIFHADPHAGNLMLLDDGSVGLYDWGLSGELDERDRHAIAGMLRAVIALDIDRLAGVLGTMAGPELDQAKVAKELRKLGQKLKQKPVGMAQTLNECLNLAARLKIAMPPNLLLMAKALITIEGLAKGIDPKVSLKLIAAPVLLRAAKPGLRDWWNIARSTGKLLLEKKR